MNRSCDTCRHEMKRSSEPPCNKCYSHMSKWEPKETHPPQPAPEPELMYMINALAKAKAQGGGEVWFEKNTSLKCVVAKTGAVKWTKEDSANSVLWDVKSYTVRPLSDPYPLDFAEAWEALGRGESVEFIGDSGNMNKINRFTSINAKALYGKRFRIANERKEA